MFKTYREGTDEMEKVSLSHINRLSRENRDFSRWPTGKKGETVPKLASEKFPGLKNHFSWVSFCAGNNGDTHFAQKLLK